MFDLNLGARELRKFDRNVHKDKKKEKLKNKSITIREKGGGQREEANKRESKHDNIPK